METRRVLLSIALCALLILAWLLYTRTSRTHNKFIIITDLEPDDRIALHIVAARIPQHEILFVGTNIRYAALKEKPARRLLDQLGLHTAPIYQDDELRVQIEAALRTHHDIQFVLLSAPTDLVAVLAKHPLLQKNIKHIHSMGGWHESHEDGQTVLRTTYNWSVDPEASALLMAMHDIPMTLYSSHMIKKFFKEGSCNIETCTAVIERLLALQSKTPSLQDQAVVAASWDKSIDIQVLHKGKQFAPADPLVIVGIINHNLITAQEFVDVHIEGSRVYVTPNPHSKIRVVQAINPDIFQEELLLSLDQAAQLQEFKASTQ